MDQLQHTHAGALTIHQLAERDGLSAKAFEWAAIGSWPRSRRLRRTAGICCAGGRRRGAVMISKSAVLEKAEKDAFYEAAVGSDVMAFLARRVGHDGHWRRVNQHLRRVDRQAARRNA